jgi:beta-lactamase regulating signal transducer with metallopeptidase domain
MTMTNALLQSLLRIDQSPAAALAFRSTVAVVLTFAVAVAARHARASLRHLAFAALFAFLLVLPVATQLLPNGIVDVPPGAAPAVAAPVVSPIADVLVARSVASTPSPLDVAETLAIVYLGGVAMALLWLAAGIVRLRRLSRSGDVWLDGTARLNEIAYAAGIRRPVLVTLSGAVSVPMTYGFLRQTIILPEAARGWTADALRRALRHELEHVRRDDWAVQLVARIALAVYWPQPLVWLAWRRFCLEAERACDDAVVTMDAASADYAQQLVTLARGLRRATPVPALAMASPSKLAQRIDAILDPRQPRGAAGRVPAFIAILAILTLAVTIAPLRVMAAVAEPHFDGSPLAEAIVSAAAKGDIETIDQLLRAGADIDANLPGDGTPLLNASCRGQRAAVRFLLDRGADVNAASPGDGNALIAAATHDQAEIVGLLLDRGARIDEVVPGDENALIGASASGSVNAAELLIHRGANVNARVWVDGELRTPLNMARRHGHDDVEKLLLDAGARE